MTKQLGSIALLVAVIALAAEALAIDLPKRKSGLWDIKISRTSTKHPPQTLQMCIDQKTDDMAQQMGENVARQACSKQQIRREGNKIVGDSVCKIGETTATSHTVFSGEFDRAYRGEIRTKYSPPLMGTSENLTLIEAKWIGPCQADQEPGDMIMPNGMKINIKQLQIQ
jgi:hypothetical protein